jgi:hypothetical protein
VLTVLRSSSQSVAVLGPMVTANGNAVNLPRDRGFRRMGVGESAATVIDSHRACNEREKLASFAQ